MIILIAGASHTGKTLLAQRLLEKYHWPYLSIDHLKMGLIRSKNTALTPLSNDGDLTEYLWPIVCEIIKTAIENEQNLIVEGCYIPFDWANSFENKYINFIRCFCLIMTEDYIHNHFDDIKKFERIIEKRLDDDFTAEYIISQNAAFHKFAEKPNTSCILIHDKYDINKQIISEMM